MAKFTSKSTGDQLTAAEYNNVQLPREDILTTSGITGTSGDNTQLAKAVANYAAVSTYYTDSGAADAYVLNAVNSFRSPTAYVDGLEVRFRAGNANTGASTVNVAGLGVKNIKKQDGTTDISTNDITADEDSYLRFDLANDAFILTEGSISRTLQSVQVFTSSGTWNKPAGINAVVVEVQGAGGGGAGAAALAVGGGGASGGYSRKLITSGLGASETITIGTGGAGGPAGIGAGTSGGISSFGAHASATGGGGGNSNGTSGIPGVGSGGTNNITGNSGQSGTSDDADAKCGTSGGGSPFFGGGPQGVTGAGVAGATNSGAGGGGGYNNTTGGGGADGIIVVWEYS